MLSSDNFIVIDFYDVARNLKIEFSILNKNEQDENLSKLFEIFFLNIKKENLLEIPLWQYLKKENSIGIHLPNAASDRSIIFNQILSVKDVFFIFDFEYCTDVFRFEDLSQLFKVLEECYNFNFYIFDTNFTFLISWNKDEVIFGSGVAQDWILKIGQSWSLLHP